MDELTNFLTIVNSFTFEKLQFFSDYFLETGGRLSCLKFLNGSDQCFGRMDIFDFGFLRVFEEDWSNARWKDVIVRPAESLAGDYFV